MLCARSCARAFVRTRWCCARARAHGGGSWFTTVGNAVAAERADVIERCVRARAMSVCESECAHGPVGPCDPNGLERPHPQHLFTQIVFVELLRDMGRP